jgi:hypothetical protein
LDEMVRDQEMIFFRPCGSPRPLVRLCSAFHIHLRPVRLNRSSEILKNKGTSSRLESRLVGTGNIQKLPALDASDANMNGSRANRTKNRAFAGNANRRTGISLDKTLMTRLWGEPSEGRAGIEPTYKSLAKEMPYRLAIAP